MIPGEMSRLESDDLEKNSQVMPCGMMEWVGMHLFHRIKLRHSLVLPVDETLKVFLALISSLQAHDE